MVRFKHLVGLVVLCFAIPAMASHREMALALMGDRVLKGYAELPSEHNEVMRELRLIPDEDGFKLIGAGIASERLSLEHALTFKVRHPLGPWTIELVRFLDPQSNLVVDFAFRPDPALELEGQHYFQSTQHPTLPRVAVAVKRMDKNQVLLRGGLATEDQPEALEQMIEFFKTTAELSYKSFTEAQIEECEQMLSRSRIRTIK